MTADIRLHPPEERDRSRGQDPEGSVRSDPALIAEGWTRRNLADADRARELTELYRELGYEVKAVRLTPADFGAACRDCAPLICRSYVMIYTRKTDDATDRVGHGPPPAR